MPTSLPLVDQYFYLQREAGDALLVRWNPKQHGIKPGPRKRLTDDENLNYLIATGIIPGKNSGRGEINRQEVSHAWKRGNKKKDFDEAHCRAFYDYFSETLKYDEKYFERRFRMPRALFNSLFSAIKGKGIFVRSANCIKRQGIHPLVRVTAALIMLEYGQSADTLDEYLQMGKDSVGLSMKNFCELVVSEFGEEFLRESHEKHLRRIMEKNAARGFPGCIGSIYCQHWRWKNCPTAWAGQFKGKEKSQRLYWKRSLTVNYGLAFFLWVSRNFE